MTLTQNERAEFVNSYTRVLINAWSSEDYAAKLETDPRGALAEAGIELPGDATVTISRAVPDASNSEGGVEVQVDLFETGLETGHFEFKVPLVPQVDTAELSESDLEGVAAGGDINCCCCPCCCCT